MGLWGTVQRLFRRPNRSRFEGRSHANISSSSNFAASSARALGVQGTVEDSDVTAPIDYTAGSDLQNR